MLFVGYPISYETACGFLGLPADVDEATFKKLYAMTNLELYYVDKGQYILGTFVKERFLRIKSMTSFCSAIVISISWAFIACIL